MLKTNIISFKADIKPQQTGFNNYRQSETPQMSYYPNDIIDIQAEAERKALKKQKQKERLEKYGVYGTVAIGAALVVVFMH